MFCYQCEQTKGGTGCTTQGVCGKDPTTATLQDLLIYATEGIAQYAHRARKLGATDRDVNLFTVEALFSTITNVNFDPERLQGLLCRAADLKARAQKIYLDACRKQGVQPETLSGPANWTPAPDIDGLLAQGKKIGIIHRHEQFGDEKADLMDLILFGLKGAAAYADHAAILGKEDDRLYARFHELLDYLTRDRFDTQELLNNALAVGELNLGVTELLDRANTSAYGDPVPTRVRVTPVRGKAICVSGHDLRDLAALLEQTKDKNINIYTHGEMLPAHGYPKLKAYKHLVGNYGSAWQNQQKEFPLFPGAILMTTNCIQRPQESYKDRIFTSGLVAWPGVRHVTRDDFSPVIEAALAQPGFVTEGVEHYITVGFGRNTLLSKVDEITELIQSQRLRHIFLIGGCDGAKPGRNYYTQFAQLVPDDCLILTLACGKYRFNKLEFGTIENLPRLWDVGQCNDSYSAIQFIVALSKALGVNPNELPLSLILSWYEQKAVAVLLTLLYLGIKNIRLGPSLPAFLTPGIVQILVDKFNFTPISTPAEDLKAILD
ncbi:MAG: hydroxylamine reductase [candidate division WOR-3 bacterium]|nr:hydroxylamine reductase [candidate division WOR-3 bacterium]MCR4424178.1 hydroxylamine reductase [candidate division WOR-3 bacterium]MDH7519403.1 hydroxylamine reductase [bacterium]